MIWPCDPALPAHYVTATRDFVTGARERMKRSAAPSVVRLAPLQVENLPVRPQFRCGWSR